jgi:tetratricopeptide (TPR) repeat protein
MQLRLIDPDLIRMIAETARNAEEDQMEFVFDDEPLEHILYGIGERGPTSASLYDADRRCVREIRAALKQGSIEAAINSCAALAARDSPISVGMCSQLAAILRAIIPQVPNPILPGDLGPLRPLLEKIWETAVEKQHVDLQKAIGSPLYRWYEHHGIYNKAHGILGRLLEISAEQGDLFEEAICWNNLGFEHLLEGRFKEAMPHFDRAARLFEQIGDQAQCANSRSNRWICRFELGITENLDQVETELQKLAELLGRWRFWQARKPLILLARISEQRGRIREAVELVKRAIQSAARSGTRYPEADAEYLGRLEAALASG